MDAERRHLWDERHRRSIGDEVPSPFVVRALELVGPPPGAIQTAPRALDVACGRGRHTLLLGRAGFAVDAVDYALPALVALRRAALREQLAIHCLAADVTTWPLPRARYALVVIVSFLERALFPVLRDAVAPGGALLVETFLEGQEKLGHPTNPAYLLRRGELAAVVADWSILDAHEGATTRHGRAVVTAGILARRPIDTPTAFRSYPPP